MAGSVCSSLKKLTNMRASPFRWQRQLWQEGNRLRGGQELSARSKMDPPARLCHALHLGTGRCCATGSPSQAVLRAAGRDAAGSPCRCSLAPFVSLQRVPPARAPGYSLRCSHLRRRPRYRCRAGSALAGLSPGSAGYSLRSPLSPCHRGALLPGGLMPKYGGTQTPWPPALLASHKALLGARGCCLGRIVPMRCQTSHSQGPCQDT